ncbi:MAG: 6-bladed beta-propeller [Acidimicrobiia bacterium]|nr:6-bladed beta-propeller [Acidimicrobiia bacterium]
MTPATLTKPVKMILLALLAGVVLLCGGVRAQQPATPAPDIAFDAQDMLKMPPDLYLGEIAGVALNSKKHIFVYTRTAADNGQTILEPTSARIFEFNPDGTFLKEIGKNLYSKGWAHAVRVDREDNIWLVDNGTDEVVKLGPDYRVKLILGRRNEPVQERVRRVGMNPGNPPPAPRTGYFYEPTDVAFDAQGNIFISDGYQNSVVHKFDKDGHIVKMAGGARGSAPGQFSTPHGIAVDAKGLVYVADRSNARIQVLDNDLNYVREIKYDPPQPAGYVSPIPDFGKRADGRHNTLWPNTLCITPGEPQYIYANSMFPGQIQKITLDGKVVGQFGTAGRKVGQFGWVHAIACVAENELWIGELLNWRVQRFLLKPGTVHRSSRGQ